MNSNAPIQAADCARIRRLLPLASHDLLDDLDASVVRAHLNTCASCAAEHAAYDRVESAVRHYSSVSASAAPLLAREDIMRTVMRSTPKAAPSMRAKNVVMRRSGVRRMLAGLPAIAAVIALVALAVAVFGGHGVFTPGGTGGNHVLSTDVELRGVSMVTATDGWAVGDDDPVGKQTAMLLHYTGVRWEQVALPAGLDSTVSLNSISMISTSEGWAVGSTWPETGANTGRQRAVLLHYTGGAWKVVPNSFPIGLTGVFMRTASDGWIASGDANGGLLLHYDGASWRQVTASALIGFSINSVAPVSASDVWITAVGPAVNGMRTASSILHFDGHTWAAAALPLGNAALSKIVMVSATEGWAVGGYCGCGNVQGPSSNSGSLILHYQNGVWSEVTNPSHPLSQDLFDIAMSSATEGWAVGFGGALLHYSSGVWTTINVPTTKGILSLSVTNETDGWAVGDQGTILQLQYGAWTLYSGDVEPLTAPADTPVPTPTKTPQRSKGTAATPSATATPYPR
ncbi:MAG TPA: zf-HC2 domain-containing protein [Ktedonobacterales bacterium]